MLELRGADVPLTAGSGSPLWQGLTFHVSDYKL